MKRIGEFFNKENTSPITLGEIMLSHTIMMLISLTIGFAIGRSL